MIDPRTPDLELLDRLAAGELGDAEAAGVRDAIERHRGWREAFEQVRENRSLAARLASTSAQAAAGADAPRIEGFEIHHELHRGGQGVVFAATQISTGRRVALKLLLQGRLATPLQRLRFEREVDLAGSLTHPNIVKVFDRGEATTGEPYYVMELVDGQPLDAFIGEMRPPQAERMRVLRTIADAVATAHRRGVIHRDLKPSNILIDERGEPRVLDFGLAKPAEAIETQTLATEAGGFVGTLRYASPEQLGGDPGAIDVRTDVYSLAVIMYESLTGGLPYPSDAPLSELARSITELPPIRPRVRLPRMDADLETILLKALEKDPARRYQSASELLGDLDRFAAGEPITARPPTAAYQLRKLVQRHKPVAAALAVVFVVLVAALAVVSASLLETRHARDAAERRFDQVQDLATTFMFDVHDEIMILPGATRARETLVSTAIDYLDSLAEDAGDDPELRGDIARGYIRVGHVQGNPDHANLGDAKGAMASYRKSLALHEALAAERPEDLEARRGVGLCHEHIGDIQMRSGESEAGTASFQRAHDVLQTIADELADRPDRQIELLRDVAAMRSKLGRATITLGKDDEARALFESSLELRRGLAQRRPENDDIQRDLSSAHIALGDELDYHKAYDEALEHYEAAGEIRRRLVDRRPNNAQAKRDMGIVLNRIGNVQRDIEDYDGALETYTRYHEICRELADADPDNAEAVRDLTVSLEKLGNVMARTERDGEALMYYTRCAEIRLEVVSSNPDDARAVVDLTIAQQQIGNTLMARGEVEEARAMYERVLGRRVDLSQRDPGNARFSILVSQSHYKIGDTLAADGADTSRTTDARRTAWASARSAYERGLDVVRGLQEEGRLPSNRASYPDLFTAEIAACDEALASLAVAGESS